VGASAPGQQQAQSDLVQDALTGEGFREQADHEAQHRDPTVEPFSPFESFVLDLISGGALEPLAVGLGRGGGHDSGLNWGQRNGVFRRIDNQSLFGHHCHRIHTRCIGPLRFAALRATGRQARSAPEAQINTRVKLSACTGADRTLEDKLASVPAGLQQGS
jgi:hypothetical protein